MPNTATAAAMIVEFDRAPEQMSDDRLVEYVRGKLDLALSLASNSEQARRSRRWESAEQYHGQWQVVMAEVQRLLPAVRARGVSLFESRECRAAGSRRRRRTSTARIVPMLREEKADHV